MSFYSNTHTFIVTNHFNIDETVEEIVIINSSRIPIILFSDCYPGCKVCNGPDNGDCLDCQSLSGTFWDPQTTKCTCYISTVYLLKLVYCCIMLSLEGVHNDFECKDLNFKFIQYPIVTVLVCSMSGQL